MYISNWVPPDMPQVSAPDEDSDDVRGALRLLALVAAGVLTVLVVSGMLNPDLSAYVVMAM